MWIIVGVVIVVAVLLAGVREVLKNAGGADPTSISVGDCVTLSGDNTDVGVRPTSCSNQSFNYIVAEKWDLTSIPCAGTSPSQVKYENSGKLCLAPNLRVGKCYRFPIRSTNDAVSAIGDVDCSVPANSSSVTLEVTARADELSAAQCASPARIFDFPYPKKISYCLRAPPS